jgi:hypothetical protein
MDCLHKIRDQLLAHGEALDLHPGTYRNRPVYKGPP